MKIRKRKRKSKRLIIIILLLVLAWVLVSLGIAVKVGLSLTMKENKPIEKNPQEYGLKYENFEALSRDGATKLKGWVIPPSGETKMTIIFSHGYGGNRYDEGAELLPLSKELSEAGFRVVMFDFRNSGESEGKMTTVGVKEKLDLLGIIDWTKGKYSEPIGLYGISMGASASLLAGSETQDVIAIVADSPFRNLQNYLTNNMPIWTNLPDFPYTPLIMKVIPLLANIDIDEASPTHEIENFYPRPILFIHSVDDKTIPYSESERMFRQHSDKFQLWLTEKAGHVKSFSMYPEEYVNKLIVFYDNALSITGD